MPAVDPGALHIRTMVIVLEGNIVRVASGNGNIRVSLVEERAVMLEPNPMWGLVVVQQPNCNVAHFVCEGVAEFRFGVQHFRGKLDFARVLALVAMVTLGVVGPAGRRCESGRPGDFNFEWERTAKDFGVEVTVKPYGKGIATSQK